MTQYYSRVQLDTGMMAHNHTNFTDDPKYPVNATELALVPLNEELITYLVSTDPDDHSDLSPIDWSRTYFDFNLQQWQIAYLEITIIDPVQSLEEQRQQYITEARLKLKIIDLPDNMREQINEYISSLNSLNIDLDDYQTIIIPKPPF